MTTHKGVQMTYMGVDRLCWGVGSIPHQQWGVGGFYRCVVTTLNYRIYTLV